MRQGRLAFQSLLRPGWARRLAEQLRNPRWGWAPFEPAKTFVFVIGGERFPS